MSVSDKQIGSHLERAQKLLPRVAAGADRIDRKRKLPPELADEIVENGLFNLLVPKSIGGAEMDWLEYLAIIEAFGKADASTAWCVNQANVFASRSAVMPEPLAREIYGDGRSVVANGPPTTAELVPVDGGYRLTGNWLFSSGCHHANWMGAIAAVKDAGKSLMCLVPKAEVKLVDVWQVSGLRGTGSFGFEVEDLFVPPYRTFDQGGPSREDGPLYVFPTALFFASGFACVALGNARAGLDAAIELAGGKKPRLDTVLLRDNPVVQQQVGKAEAIWGSARAFLLDNASAAWKGACRNGALTLEERIRLRLAASNAIRMAAEVVDIGYNLCGSNAIFAHNPVHRRFQDAHAITQQIQGRLAHYETAGQFFLGLEPEGN